MTKKEFTFSVLASIVAAAILEVSGVFSSLHYLKIDINIPLWAILVFITCPILGSMYWFRNSITPEHEQVSKELDAEQKDKANVLAQLEESRNHTRSLELLLNEAKTNLNVKEDKLQLWEQRGVMLSLEDSPSEQVVNKVFGSEIVTLDSKDFIGCTFEGTILKIMGTGPIGLQHCNFNDVRWVMDKPASNAISVLSAFYQSGNPVMQKIVEHTFDNIRNSAQKAS